MTSTFKTPTDIRFDKFEEFFKERNKLMFDISRSLPAQLHYAEHVSITFVQDMARLNVEWQVNSDFYSLMDIEGNEEVRSKQQIINALIPLLVQKLRLVAERKQSPDHLTAYLAEVEEAYLRIVETFIKRN